MKKVISIMLCTFIMLSIFSFSFTANSASGWAQTAKKVHLDSTFSDEFTESDYNCKKGDVAPYYAYFDAFCFYVPAKGKVTLRVECEDDIASYCDYDIYKSNDLDNYYESFSNNSVKSGFNSGRNIYYDEMNVTLNAGSYYLVSEQSTFMTGLSSAAMQYTLSYKPSFSNTSISKIKAKKKALSVNWYKASGVSGYKIQYSLKKNMKSAKTITINKQSKASKKITKLKKKKKYYVRIRTFKKMKVEGINKTYYGNWSAKKKVKTK